MRKLVYILFLVALSACHKELIKYPVDSLEAKVVLALKKQLPAADFEQLDLYQIEKISHNNAAIVACKIAFENNNDSSYSFVLVNVHNDVVGAVYRNDISYTSMHGGNYPVAVRNLNYATEVLQEYSLRGGLKTSASYQSLIQQLGIPPVTTSGVYTKSAETGAEKLTAIESYIFCGLLGMGSFEAAANDLKPSKVKVQYFNPYSKNDVNQEDVRAASFLEWDVQLK